jgi:hypothetical protein
MARVNLLQSPMQHEGWVDGEQTRNIFPLDFNSLANYLHGISKPNAHSSEHFKGEKYFKNGAGLSTG